MINLLPPEDTSRLRYGRINAILRLWLIGSVLATGGLLLIFGGGWVYIDKQNRDLSSDIAATKQQLEAQNLEGVKKQAAEITGNIKIINQVLSREISFSALTQSIGQVMPPGTILGGLTLSKLDSVIDLNASAKDYAAAATVAANLSDPANKIFGKVDIVSITCNPSGGAYPCSGNFKALFSQDSKNRFLNVPQKEGQQ